MRMVRRTCSLKKTGLKSFPVCGMKRCLKNEAIFMYSMKYNVDVQKNIMRLEVSK